MRSVQTLRGGLMAAALAATAMTASAAEVKTSLASLTVSALPQAKGAAADWVPVYDYHGGALPPGTRVTAEGKWLDATVKMGADGLTYGFPDLPNKPGAAQWLRPRFSVERVFANYPTRLTVKFTLHYDQSKYDPGPRWSALDVTSPDLTFNRILSLQNTDPLNLTGANTFVLQFDGNGPVSALLNGKPLVGSLGSRIKLKKAGAELMPGLAISTAMVQFPSESGPWYTINAVQVEQQRSPLAQSAAAALELKVPGPKACRVSIEAVDQNHRGMGWVLKDAEVQPGTYPLYWDAIDEKTSQPEGSVAARGPVWFRMVTSQVAVSYAGELDNTVPPYSFLSYAQLACSALALTPPGTPAPNQLLSSAFASNHRADTRAVETKDSVQCANVGYDSNWGGWVGADGSVIHTKTQDPRIQRGRALALTPPDTAAPNDPTKQFYFASTSIGTAQGVVTCSLPSNKTFSKKFGSPDWNHGKSFWPYRIQVGRVEGMPGEKHFLYLRMSPKAGMAKGEWTVRNVRIFEEGQAEPAAIRFDQARFTARNLPRPGDKDTPIAPGSVTVSGDGTGVRMKDAGSVNYPLDYTVTPKTILSFELQLADRGNGNFGEGIGLDASPVGDNSVGLRSFFNFLPGGDRWGFRDESIGAGPMPDWQPDTLYPEMPSTLPTEMDPGLNGRLLFATGYYGLAISEDGRYLFACNNADNRLEVRDIMGDGGMVTSVKLDHPMFVALGPSAGGTRALYVNSPAFGMARLVWNAGTKSLGKPEVICPAANFAYPRGLVYNAAVNRLVVCDAFTPDLKKVNNQLVVLTPDGQVVSRFGKAAGPLPYDCGNLRDDTFSSPLTVVADSQGAVWLNDFYSGEVRKYRMTAAGEFTLERRVMGPNTTNASHQFWMPGDPPTRAWAVGNQFTRLDTTIGADGRFTNTATTATTPRLNPMELRPFPHFSKLNGRVYATFAATGGIWELMGDSWKKRVEFGANAGEAARENGLLSTDAAKPSALDKAIAAAKDADWEKRAWV